MNVESANSPGFKDWKLVLKLFLPSWNFFNDFDVVPQLEFRLTRAGQEDLEWRPLYPVRSMRSWRRVLFNPSGNLELQEKSLIDRVATALRESDASIGADFARSDDCALLTRIARGRIQQLVPEPAVTAFRFRLVIAAARAAGETLLESTAQPLAEPGR
jgi:hypothetical protein